MKLYSTRNADHIVDLKTAVKEGLAPDGGLYMPTEIPELSDGFLDNLSELSFQEIAFEVAKKMMQGAVPDVELRKIVEDAINFEAPLVQLGAETRTYVLELFHGPTLAFKDFGARFMARLMAYFLEQENEEITILVATSGDTGSAVAQGFYNVPGINVVILYPSGKVSDIQEQQLTTIGGNISALEVDGVFDDCQRMVKEAFLDEQLKRDITLSSANSINIARLIPQSFYYFQAVAQLPDERPVVFSVPSGNFGNLTAGLFAKKMRLQFDRVIAATNANRVVPDYLESGQFKPRSSVKTISNAMDVGNPSNFERMLDLYKGDIEALRKDVWGASYSDDATRAAIRFVKESNDYLLDPHGAVGYLGLQAYRDKKGGGFNGVILETAHPVKFKDEVEPLLPDEKVEIPPRLQKCMDRKKQATKIVGRTEQLIDYLRS